MIGVSSRSSIPAAMAALTSLRNGLGSGPEGRDEDICLMASVYRGFARTPNAGIPGGGFVVDASVKSGAAGVAACYGRGMKDKRQNELFGEALPNIKPLSAVERRLIRSAEEIAREEPRELLFQHTVFCQTGLPYRNPGDDVRVWERNQGHIGLSVEAGRVRNPDTSKFVDLGLPFGPKPRLILTHLNAEALRQGSPEIEVDDSLTAFVRRILDYEPNGKEMRLFKDQLGRLSAALVRLSIENGSRAFQIDTKVVTAFDLWFPKDQRQRVLWPSVIRLSHEYFESLQRHAVPLDERAIASLSHSAMGLDVYCWLAQRLHRVDPARPQFIPWSAVKDQFGWQYKRMVEFRRVFRRTLDMVLSQYRAAQIELDGRGLTLRNSPPPIKGRMGLISKS